MWNDLWFVNISAQKRARICKKLKIYNCSKKVAYSTNFQTTWLHILNKIIKQLTH